MKDGGLLIPSAAAAMHRFTVIFALVACHCLFLLKSKQYDFNDYKGNKVDIYLKHLTPFPSLTPSVCMTLASVCWTTFLRPPSSTASEAAAGPGQARYPPRY